MNASTSRNASASSRGMTDSNSGLPSTSLRVNPVARSQASLKSMMRPCSSSTQTSACVVCVRASANASPSSNVLFRGNSLIT